MNFGPAGACISLLVLSYSDSVEESVASLVLRGTAIMRLIQDPQGNVTHEWSFSFLGGLVLLLHSLRCPKARYSPFLTRFALALNLEKHL